MPNFSLRVTRKPLTEPSITIDVVKIIGKQPNLNIKVTRIFFGT